MSVRHEAQDRESKQVDVASEIAEANLQLVSATKEQVVLILHSVWGDLAGPTPAAKARNRLIRLYQPTTELKLKAKVAALEAEVAALKESAPVVDRDV